MSFEAIATLDELWSGEMISRASGGRKILLIRLGEAVSAFEDRCAHLGVALSEGELCGEVIVCGAHRYEYDAKTGAGINPRSVCLTVFPVRIEGDRILVDVDQPTRGDRR
jgi:toluene monooxygenase system ferredoxin subunit